MLDRRIHFRSALDYRLLCPGIRVSDRKDPGRKGDTERDTYWSKHPFQLSISSHCHLTNYRMSRVSALHPEERFHFGFAIPSGPVPAVSCRASLHGVLSPVLLHTVRGAISCTAPGCGMRDFVAGLLRSAGFVTNQSLGSGLPWKPPTVLRVPRHLATGKKEYEKSTQTVGNFGGAPDRPPPGVSSRASASQRTSHTVKQHVADLIFPELAVVGETTHSAARGTASVASQKLMDTRRRPSSTY